MKNKEEANDLKEVNDLFDFENVHNEEEIIKKAKKKSYIKIILISLGISITVLTLGVASKLQITPHITFNKIAAIESYYNIVGADIFLGPWDEQNNIFNSGATTCKYKLVGNKPVYIGELDINKVNFDNYLVTGENNTYSYYGNKVMEFYHPLVEYDKYSNDLSKVNDIDSNKNIEMALSFDKQYTLEEVENILPKDVKINWLWVDTYKDNSLESLKKFDNGITQMEAKILTENQVVGFHTIKQNGTYNEKPVEDFIENIKFGLSHGGKYKEEINNIYKDLTENNKDLTESDIKIIGAVVVADKDNLSKLKNINTIKSSSLGVINDKY